MEETPLHSLGDASGLDAKPLRCSSCLVVAAALVAASFACAPGQSPEPIVGLEPVAAVPLDAFGAEARVPGWATSPGVYGNRVSYVDLGGRRLVELDVESGRVLWERVDYMTIGETETECGRKSMGVPTPQGGWVFPACRRELVFLEHRDDAAVTVVRAPNYLGPTLVTVVMRPPGRNGISKQAIDWYDIGGVEFGPGGQSP